MEESADTSVLFLDMQASLAPTMVRPSSVGKSLRDTFSIWDLTKRRDDIALTDMVADMEVDKVHVVHHQQPLLVHHVFHKIGRRKLFSAPFVTQFGVSGNFSWGLF